MSFNVPSSSFPFSVKSFKKSFYGWAFLLGDLFPAIWDVSGSLFFAGSSLCRLFYTPSFMEYTALALGIVNGLSLTTFGILYQALSLRDTYRNPMILICWSADASTTILMLNKLHKMHTSQQKWAMQSSVAMIYNYPMANMSPIAPKLNSYQTYATFHDTSMEHQVMNSEKSM